MYLFYCFAIAKYLINVFKHFQFCFVVLIGVMNDKLKGKKNQQNGRYVVSWI